MRYLCISLAVGLATAAFVLFLVYYAGEDIFERSIGHAYFLLVGVLLGGMAAFITNGKLKGEI